MYNSKQEFIVGPKVINLKKDEPYITLQSLLQVVGAIQTGGMAKIYLAETTVLVNGEPENRRGRKLYGGDEVRLPEAVFMVK